MLKTGDLTEFTSKKILSLEKAQQKVAQWKEKGKKVGLCHGGFDLLHPGHMKHFESAKQLCDVLIVSVTSDKYVSSRKGSGRPVMTDTLRAYAIASLAVVDVVVIVNFDTGVEVIRLLEPSFYIKGPDFIGKTTPGIVAEQKAIQEQSGEMKYTADVKLSTTEIIKYVKHELQEEKILLIIDRDGTLIEHESFFGKNKEWKKHLHLNHPVADYLFYLQTRYTTTKIVASNQAGVARDFYTSDAVESIHQQIQQELQSKDVHIDSWQFCPDVDTVYAEQKKNEVSFNPLFVKEKTKRKPGTAMVQDALKELNKTLGDFDKIIVLGDQEEDSGLAKNLDAQFIDVKGKRYEELVKEFW